MKQLPILPLILGMLLLPGWGAFAEQPTEVTQVLTAKSPAPTPGPDPVVTPAQTATADSGEAPESPAEPTPPKNLFLLTLPLDIRTASYYELVNWCRRLGIDQAGDRKNLQQKLYAHYDVRPAPAVRDTAAAPKEGKEVKVIYADLARYFTIEDIDEKYVQLEGNVAVTIKEKNITHEIRAQRITVNQALKILTAEGDIYYVKTDVNKKNKPEIYYGDSLSFDISSSEGIFYNGRGESEKDVIDEKKQEKAVKFIYKGRKITKLENDVILLDDAVITSSQSLVYPNWKIKAPRIWVLAPDEWATRNAVLYIGEIPFLWLPYFFNPGDDLFFNPVIGYRSREGKFVQTTTYLAGEKPKAEKDTTFSFINISDDEDTNYTTEISGLFLRKVKTDEPPKPAAGQGEYLKVMLDIYSRLGLFAGVDLNLFTGKLKMLAGAAASRTVYQPAGGNYTFLIPDEEGNPGSEWNSSSVFGFDLPVRYGLDTKFDFTLWKFPVNGQMEFYSDPFFPSDFYSRSENMEFLDLLDLEGMEPPAPVSEKNKLNWSAGTSYNLDLQKTTPYLSQAKLGRLGVSFDWAGKETILPSPAPGAPTPAPASVAFNADPARKFFYPSRLAVPEAQVQISGKLLDISTKQERKPTPTPTPTPTPAQLQAGAPAADQAGSPAAQPLPKTAAVRPDQDLPLRSPFTQTLPTGPQQPGDSQAEQELRVMGIMANETGIKDLNLSADSSITVSYSLRPEFNMESHYAFDAWQQSADIDYQVKYSQYGYKIPFTLDSNFNLWGDLLTFKGILTFNLDEKERFNRNKEIITEETWTDLQSKDEKDSLINVNQNVNLTFKPLRTVYDFRDSQVNYTLGWNIYSHRYDLESDTILDKIFDWEKESITAHSLNGWLVYNYGIQSVKLKVNTQWPPLDKRITPNLEFTVWKLTNLLTTSIKEVADEEVEDEWEYDPLAIKSNLRIDPWLNFTETISYNYIDDLFSNSTSTLELKFLDNNLQLLENFEYNFQDEVIEKFNSTLKFYTAQLIVNIERFLPRYYDFVNLRWSDDNPETPEIEGTEKVFGLSSLALKYAQNFTNVYFWKNRIRLNWDLLLDLKIDFNQVTNSEFKTTLKLEFEIYKFTILNFTVNSLNSKMYRYFDLLLDKVRLEGDETINIFDDLLKSFNFFDGAQQQDRKNSHFNMQDISLALTHYLEDWVLSIAYSGQFKDNEDLTGKDWVSTFTIAVEWMPIPKIKKEIKSENSVWDIGG